MTTMRTRLPGAGHLLLLAALLLGIVTMHTLGHPREHGPDAERATAGHARVAEAVGHARVAVDGGEHAQVRAAHGTAHGNGERPADPPSAHTAQAPQAPSPHDSGMDPDPLSLCLAVLGAALTLALLYAAVHHGSWGTPVHVHRLARVLDTLRPNPPPPRTLLAHLSVLRV
ncbi:hypothetical protein GCM10010252_37510 [Streptomyces aureoverticillatus]|nr:hypothetical protein GCM10010252_37510 [Streptomyces aureoverticillatus]